MNAIANIIVQLVHIEGPLKGEIQDFFETVILIGRHPDCQVKYPKDLVTISRKHASIQREGNRFKIIDQSTNGTFVNGKPVTEDYLKDGDVIIFSEGGPKLSFLTHLGDSLKTEPKKPLEKKQVVPASEFIPAPESPPLQDGSPKPPETDLPSLKPQSFPEPPSHPAKESIPPKPDHVGEKIKVPFAIQYGPMLKSFQTLPITIGQGEECDFVLNHDGIEDLQAQIFYYQEQYWIKDLTGLSSIYLDGVGIVDQAPLKHNTQLLLSVKGPLFRFLGNGRLAEIETTPPESSESMVSSGHPEESQELASPDTSPDNAKETTGSISQKAGSLFKKFFSS